MIGFQRVDSYAAANYMSRSGLISFATNQYLNQAELIMLVKDMSVSMRKIADSGMVDSETEKQLQDFERACKVLTGQ